MSKYNKGEIYFANVRFDEGIGAKIRPVLVVEYDGVKVSAYKMTSHAPRDEQDYPLRDWVKSGLRRETTVRLNKPYCIDPADMRQKIGDIQQYDWEKIIAKQR
jgi:hypothetical protein